jgi:hypothetical protein
MIVKLLKQLQVTTTLLCEERQPPASMVRPIINKVVKSHLLPKANDNNMMKKSKALISEQLQEHFILEWKEGTSVVNERQISSFIDPRYKEVEDETVPAMQAAREHVRHSAELLNKMDEEDNTKHATNTESEFLYKQPTHRRKGEKSQFEGYLAEP